MSPKDVLTCAAVAGVFVWLAAMLVAWFFCVHSNPLWLRAAMKLGFMAIFMRLAAATLGDMDLDYVGSLAYVTAAVVGAAVLAHHLGRVFRYGDRCRTSEG